MKQLMTGNEALARGAYEAGVHFAAAYPGTPSTEIMENLALYENIYTEWSVNEKVALEAAAGASLAGARSMASMKHVGLNVAADPLFTFAYMGVGGGCVIVSADEPGQHSSQNEQDNRNYAQAAKIPMFEPSNSQECIDMVREAFDVSEQFNTPVLIRVTTRVCHSKSLVRLQEPGKSKIRPYIKDARAHVSVPANARIWRKNVEDRMEKLSCYSETCSANKIIDPEHHKTGVITSGICYHHAREVFGDGAAYLKLGFTNPLPETLIWEFCLNKDTIYVIEENDPYIENTVRKLGFQCSGKDVFPHFGEMTPDVIRSALFPEQMPDKTISDPSVITREPTLCAGCPHRGFFYTLSKKKNIMVSGDIGCYTLACSEPYNAMDTCICMSSSFSAGHGTQKVFDMEKSTMKVVAVLGDSTFFHSGINSLINSIYNRSAVVHVILDNRITAMTGHQQNPGTGYTIKGDPADQINIEKVVRALGVQHVRTIDPNQLQEVSDTLDEYLQLDEPSVIITRWPCALKKFSKEDLQEFPDLFKAKCIVDEKQCMGCKACLKCGCPALSFNETEKKVRVSLNDCVGCNVCGQICPAGAIKKEGPVHD